MTVTEVLEILDDGCDWGWLVAFRQRRAARHARERREANERAVDGRTPAPVLPRGGDRPGWWIQATCRICGVHLEHQADGTTDGRATQAKLRCPECASGYLLRVDLVTLQEMDNRDRSTRRVA